MILLTAAAISASGPAPAHERRRIGVAQQPVPEPADGQVRDGRKGCGVMAVADQAGDVVAFVRNDRIVQNRFSADRPARIARPHALSPIRRPAPPARHPIAAASPGEQRPQIGEGPARAAKRICEAMAQCAAAIQAWLAHSKPRRGRLKRRIVVQFDD